ncbi:MAG: hypothetical protein ACRDQU_02875, partial [Pseudonocardiaceae bacterium]
MLLVLIDGQILYRGGLGYLQKVYPADSARSVMQLVTVLFHLVVLGVLALISTLDVVTGMPRVTSWSSGVWSCWGLLGRGGVRAPAHHATPGCDS